MLLIFINPNPVLQSEDPFWEPPDTPVIVGVVSVPLRFLSHMLDFQDEPLTVIDYKAKQAGFLRVDLVPCDGKAREDVDLCVKDPMDLVREVSWWRHQMETFSASLALCVGNSPVTGEFPSQRPVTRSFGVFFDLCLNKELSKQSGRQWLETPSRSLWRHFNVFRSEWSIMGNPWGVISEFLSREAGSLLNVKTAFHAYRNSHYKD